jgi:hypothetical protein
MIIEIREGTIREEDLEDSVGALVIALSNATLSGCVEGNWNNSPGFQSKPWAKLSPL